MNVRPTLSRRTFITAGLVQTGSLLASGAAAAAYARYDINGDSVTGHIITEFVDVNLPVVPPAFDGYKIGFITDIHLGIWVPGEWLSRAVEIVSAADVDLLILGGDYLCVNDDDIWERLGMVRNESFVGLRGRRASRAIFTDVLARVTAHSFRDGIVAVPGNHEHWNSTADFLELFRAERKVRLLVNERSQIVRNEQSIWLYGVDDFLTGIPRLPPSWALPGSSTNAPTSTGVSPFKVLISHNPDYVSYILNRDGAGATFDLAVCGHTHGGQVCLPGGRAVTFQVHDHTLARGLKTRGASSPGPRKSEPPTSTAPSSDLPTSRSSKIYTSRGLGVVGVPFRTFCPPEVTVLTLKRAEELKGV